MEAPLLGGGAHDEFVKSWYVGRVVEILENGLVLFEYDVAKADLPKGARAAVASEGSNKGALSAAVKLEDLRPVAPLTIDGFADAIDAGSDLELRRHGGWWKVRVLEVIGRPSADATEGEAGEEVGEDDGCDGEGGGEDGAESGAEGGGVRSRRRRQSKSADGVSGDGSGDAAGGDEVVKYRVQLPARDGKEGAQFVVDLSQLRPGWRWGASGKWVGNWVPKEKTKRQREKDAQFARVRARWPEGETVEVMQQDPGLLGSWYSGTVVGHEFPDKCVVRYFNLYDDALVQEGQEKKGKKDSSRKRGGEVREERQQVLKEEGGVQGKGDKSTGEGGTEDKEPKEEAKEEMEDESVKEVPNASAESHGSRDQAASNAEEGVPSPTTPLLQVAEH
eukprot:2008510-Pleurochrysis_carterae.AAC.1